MNTKTFTKRIAVYGSNPELWHERDKASMLALLERDPQARAALSHEAALDTWLTKRLPDAPIPLQARIVAQMEENLGVPKSAAVFSAHPRPHQASISLWSKITSAFDAPFKLGVATAFAAICFAGVLSAPALADILNPLNVLSAVDVVTDDILFIN